MCIRDSSSLVGIGGGTLSVPFLLWNNLDMRKAIGTSAAIGFPIALAGCFGYIVNGWNAANLPPYSFGYIYLPSLFGIVVVSMFTAPLGARPVSYTHLQRTCQQLKVPWVVA